MHELFFSGGLQNGPEEVQDGDGLVCDDGTGGGLYLLGRVIRDQKEGMMCVQMLFF